MNKKISIKYGAISGLLIVSSWFISLMIWGPDLNFSGGELFGYAVMILSLTAVFMGVKNRRDERGEVFTFKEGFFTGLGIVLVASTIYVVGWMIYMPNFAPDFADKYGASQIEMIQQQDIPDTEKTTQIDSIKKSIANYKKPHVMAAMTFLEIFPVGLFVALISALILKRKKE